MTPEESEEATDAMLDRYRIAGGGVDPIQPLAAAIFDWRKINIVSGPFPSLPEGSQTLANDSEALPL